MCHKKMQLLSSCILILFELQLRTVLVDAAILVVPAQSRRLAIDQQFVPFVDDFVKNI